MMQKIAPALLIICLSACGTHSKVVNLDPETNLFPTSKRAQVITSLPFDIGSRKSLILVPDSVFDVEMTKNIGYFDEVITIEDLEVLIVQNDLADKVPTARGKIGTSNAAKYYKPFLWLRYDRNKENSRVYYEFILTDALTLEDYFVAKTYLDYSVGVTDQNNWYPLYNAFINYIRENDKN